MKKKSATFKTLSIVMALMISFSASAKVHIKELSFSKADKNNGILSVKFRGKMTGEPELSVRDSIVQIEMPSAVVWPKIEKKITLGKKKFDTTLMAYQYDKSLARVRVLLPFSAAAHNDKIEFEIKKNRIDLRFPISKAKPSESALKYDESYLEQLLSDKKQTPAKTAVKKAVKNDLNSFIKKKEENKMTVDKVKVKHSSTKKKGTWGKGFSIKTFVGKVIAFFAGILLLFYGIVALIKKGVFKKSKLGFLNQTKVVQVLSTTYIAPKRSIMTIQCHDQVFLIGNSERGMHFLSEVNNVSGLMKNGEKAVSGSNFDTNLETADEQAVPMKLKEDITVSEAETNPLANFLSAGTTKTEKLSDKIKDKVKNMKSLQ